MQSSRVSIHFLLSHTDLWESNPHIGLNTSGKQSRLLSGKRWTLPNPFRRALSPRVSILPSTVQGASSIKCTGHFVLNYRLNINGFMFRIKPSPRLCYFTRNFMVHFWLFVLRNRESNLQCVNILSQYLHSTSLFLQMLTYTNKCNYRLCHEDSVGTITFCGCSSEVTFISCFVFERAIRHASLSSSFA